MPTGRRRTFYDPRTRSWFVFDREATARSRRSRGPPTSTAVKLSRILLFIVLAPWCAAAPPAEPGELAARVVIVANSDDPDSLRIARHYAVTRAVPEANIVTLRLPLAETITWREFVATLWTPLLDELVRTGWIDAIPMALTDPIGRRKYAPIGHRIAALVVCRGVPLRIAHDTELYSEVLPLTRRAEFRTNAGSVDGELSLLAWSNYPITALIPNPLFANERPMAGELAHVVRVARLDGPAVEHVIGMIDRAVAAERTGLLGRAYVDLANRDPLGDGWLETAARQLIELGLDVTVDRAAETFPATARMDAPVLYFGWYAGDVNGPFALPGFRFPPGAIALHIHSFSAQTLRSATTGWTGPLVARGVTATVGNVHEPYLQFTHQPHMLLRALVRGATLGEAAYYALQALSWQAVLIGDPLYRPFPSGAAPIPAGPPAASSPLKGYATLNRVRQLDAAGRGDEATALATEAQREAPSLALALELARRLHAAGDTAGVARALGFVSRLQELPTDQWAVAAAAARMLSGSEQPAAAVGVWRTLLATARMPAEPRSLWLREAIDVATAARDSAQARSWQRELDALTAPTKKKG